MILRWLGISIVLGLSVVVFYEAAKFLIRVSHLKREKHEIDRKLTVRLVWLLLGGIAGILVMAIGTLLHYQ
jgi:hypothetical protein